ncbi:MAG: acetyl-CoA C-acyltransferase [Myxococcales bacterium]|nr:acetyl-CoA C-acyltransferase [Myxococcales bacterium]
MDRWRASSCRSACRSAFTPPGCPVSDAARDVVVIDAVRTPRGKGRPGGALSQVKPIDLVAELLRALARRNEALDARDIDDVLLGCVTQSGEQGANLARVAALYAGWPDGVSGATLNRFCASGLDAINVAASKIAAGSDDLVVAGGVESMSRVPIFSDKGPWFADPEVAERTGFVQMGFAADLVATFEGFERAELDAYAARSHQRAAAAQQGGHFARTLEPVRDGSGGVLLDHDELVRGDTTVEALARFEPCFADAASSAKARARYGDDLVVRALHHRGSSPSLADGAALVLLASRQRARELCLAPRARVVAHGNASVEPVLMLTAAGRAAERALARAAMTVGDVDLFEINEAFAAVPLKVARDLGIDHAQLNVDGGTLAMGHAMGATGAMLFGGALEALERRDERVALVAVSGGAGLGSASVLARDDEI